MMRPTWTALLRARHEAATAEDSWTIRKALALDSIERAERLQTAEATAEAELDIGLAVEASERLEAANARLAHAERADRAA